MRLWRLSNARHARSFDGGFGLISSGRWNSVGHPVTYCSTVPSLCALEKRVHYGSLDLLPPQHMVEYVAPDDLPIREIGLSELPPNWHVRVGIHVGTVVAGIVGRRKYQYDVWGDAVNTAARMQSAPVAGSVRVSRDTWNLLAPHCSGQSVGRVEIKGKGEQELFVVNDLNG